MGLFLVSLLIVSVLPSVAIAASLVTVQSRELAKVLANFEILAEAKPPQSKGMFVRILRVQDPGECDGAPETCPKSILYVAVSEYGESPAQKVYQLPRGYNWEFVGWIRLPEHDGPTDYVQLKLKAQKPARDRSKGWWEDESYLLKANYRDGSWEKQ